MRIDSVSQHSERSGLRTSVFVLRAFVLGAMLLAAAPVVPKHPAFAADETVIRAKRSADDSDSESSSSSSDDEEGDEAAERRQARRDRMRREQGRSRRSETIIEQTATQQYGVDGRFGHIGFQTFGRNESITHAEALPFLMFDNHMLFSDVRLFMTNTELFGGNLGFGYRYLIDDYNRVFGASLWYDADDTSGALFHQAGLSLETYGKYVDIRSNLYVPVSDDQKTFSRGITGSWFSGTSILYTTRERVGEAMPGVDVEIGSLLPGDFAAKHQIRAYGGYYHFLGDLVPDISGYKARLQGNITDWFYSQVEMTKDDFYGTNFTLGAALQFSAGRVKRKTDGGNETSLMRRYVERNYNIIVPKIITGQQGVTAINPATGQPYVVRHVNTTGVGAANGTVTDPYQSIAQAQAAGGDIIFVHSGASLNVPVLMQPGQRILGEGVNHYVDVAGWGAMALPRATAGLTRPTLNNVGPNAVTLADNSEFSGFVINNPTGVGLFAGGIGNARVRNVDIVNAGGDGVLVQGGFGNLLFENVVVTNAAGAAFHVDGGNANITGTGLVNNTAGRSLVVENTTGGLINLAGLTFNDNGGTGFLFQNNIADSIIGPATIVTASATGIDIQGGTGDVAFRGTTSVTNTAGDAVSLNGAAGTVGFQTLNANATGGAALRSVNTGTLVIEGGNLSAVGSSAADISGTNMGINLTSISSDGAAVGLRILNSTGQFGVFGTNAMGTGGLIQNATVGVDIQNSGTVGLQFVDLTSNVTGVQADNVTFLQLSNTRVVNSTNYGLDALNVRTLIVNNSLFQNNGLPVQNSIRVQANQAATYDYRFQNNTILDDTAAAIAISNSGAANGSPLSLLVTANDITTALLGGDAVNVAWNGTINGTFTSNAIHGTGGLNDGFDINATSAGNMASLTFVGNSLDFSGGNDTALRITTAGASQIGVNTTLINFNGNNGTGMNFDLARSANVVLDTNTITDNATGGTGILFSNVAGPSNFRIENNWLRMLGAAPDRGIIFNAVDITNGTITLQGSFNNLVQGASQTFFIPVGTSTGSFFINGAAVP